MRQIHAKLARRYKAYRSWHEHPYHQHVHWLALIVFGVGLTLSLISSIHNIEAATITAGPNNAGTFTSDSANGGGIGWENPSNATTSDNNHATASLTLATDTTQYLKATNFGFAVPSGGTILGIKVQIEKGETCADCTVSDVEVKLVKAGSVVGDNKAIGANWPATGSGGSRYYGTASATVDGTSTDLWGTTWTPAEVNDSGFGVVISAKENSDSATAIMVDMIRMTVYYDDAGVGGGGGGGDTTPPTVSITSPAASATVSGAVNVTADASDGVAVAGVQFQANGSNIGSEDTSAPYEASWDTASISNGAYTLTAIARDSSNNQTTSSSVAVTVSNGGGGGGGGGDTSPPAVFISSPDNLSTVSGTINFTASASDETGMAGVQFKIDGTNFGSQDTSAPYSIPWDTTAVANGNYTLTALATDTSSNQTTSAALTVTVSNGGGAPAGGLVGYWSFNEGSGSTVTDSSGNNNIGTLTNGPTWTAGKFGGGLLFDGVDDKVEIPDSGTTSLDVTGTALSMSAWIYPDSVQKTYPHIMSKVKNVNNYLLYINPNGSTVTSVITTTGGTGAATCAKSAYTNNQWNLVTSVYDGTTITTYINGVAKTACARTGALTANDDSFVIGDKSNATNVVNQFKGIIDEVRVYNKALTAAEVTALYSATPSDGDTTLPSVSITDPVAFATVSGTTTVTATASDNVAITGVQFKIDGANIGAEDTTSPFSVSWSTASFANGSHSITAVARDSSSNFATSSAVSVTVNNIVGTPPPSSNNTVIITEKAGVTTTNYPVQIGRPFMQGEIKNYPKVLVNGTAVFTQADVKQRWSDGSVKHAVLSFLIPSLTANSTATLTFQNQATGNNTPLTTTEMLDSKYDFDAKIDLVSGGITKTASARTMLQNGDYTLWTSGPVATTVILADHSTARKYDLGFDSYKPFRPIFHATFWPTIDKVRVRYVGELANTEEFEDVPLSTLALKLGNTSPSTVYTKSAFTMYAGSRWTKEFWIGAAPSLVATNFNLAYLAQTKFIPNYDPSKVVSESAIDLYYATRFDAWLKMPRDLYDSGQFKKSMATTGGRAEIGPYPDWVVRWLYTGDTRMKESAFGNADLSAAWPIHFREGNISKKLDKAKTIPGFGKIISISDRPSVFLSNLTHANNKAADKIKIVGAQTDGGWKPDMAHSFDIHSPIYTSTGDYWYLEELWFWTAYGAASGDGTGGVYPFRRGPTGAEGGLTGQLRGKAWILRTRVNAAYVSPDDTVEKNYFNDLMNDVIAIEEGYKNIATSSFYQNANWTWARSFFNQPILGNPKQNQWDAGEEGSAQAQYGIDETVTKSAISGFSQDFLMFALGRAKELGYAVDNLVSYLSKFYINGFTHPDTNPYMMALGRFATIKLANSQYFSSWADLMTGYLSDTRALNSFPLQDAVHGYDIMLIAATSMVANEPGGGAAWDFVKTKILPAAILNDNPKWAILPRSVNVAPPVVDTESPSLPTNLVVTSTNASAINLTWTASTDNIGVAGYKVFRNGTQIGTANSTSFSDNDTVLVPATEYSYTVSAFDAAGNNSTPSTPVPKSLAFKINSFFASLATISPGQGTTLSWDVSGADTISIDKGVGVVTTLSGIGSRDISPIVTTTYTLTAVGGRHTLTKTVLVTVNAPPLPPPTGDTIPPVISSILVNKVGWTRALISWVTDEISDSQVQYGQTTSYGNVTDVNPFLTLTRTVLLKDLKPGKLYSFRVKSRDASGNLKNSDNLTFNTVARLPKPPKVSSIVATEGSVKLGWQKVDYEDLCKSIDIYKNKTGFLTAPLASAKPVSLDCQQESYTDTAVSPATTYYYTFFVIDDEGVASDAGTVQFTTKAAPVDSTKPTPPAGGPGGQNFTPDGEGDPDAEDPNEEESTFGCEIGPFNRFTGESCSSGSDKSGSKTSRTYNLGSVTLRLGSTGEAVKELQRFLNDVLGLGLVIDGKLGPKTIAVIKEWQKQNGLVPDGLIGPKTKALMNAGVAKKDTSSGASSGSSGQSGAYNFGPVTLRSGSTGEAVKELQRFLNDVLGLGLVIDGKLGPKTIAVIKQWQEDNGLVPDGLIGPKTKKLMNESVTPTEP